jgi:hypothetical protein
VKRRSAGIAAVRAALLGMAFGTAQAEHGGRCETRHAVGSALQLWRATRSAVRTECTESAERGNREPSGQGALCRHDVSRKNALGALVKTLCRIQAARGS